MTVQSSRYIRAGSLILVVGGSGVGKDTLIDAAKRRFAADAIIVFPRRVVTRAESVGEDHDSLDRDAFDRARMQGAFALSWDAHGLSYGVPRSVADDLAAGRSVIVNVSRRVIGDAETAFPSVAVLEITAPDSVRAERLAGRGRESAADIETRIAREAPVVVATAKHITIDNGGALDAAIAAFCAEIDRLSRRQTENGR